MEFWSFEDRGPKQPKTLMDAIEDVPVLVYGYFMSTMMVKKRKGDMGYTILEQGEVTSPDSHAANYKFIRYVDPPTQPAAPEVSALANAEPFRLFHVEGWVDFYWVNRQGRLYGTNKEATSLREQTPPHLATKITYTNIYATLTSTGDK